MQEVTQGSGGIVLCLDLRIKGEQSVGFGGFEWSAVGAQTKVLDEAFGASIVDLCDLAGQDLVEVDFGSDLFGDLHVSLGKGE